MLYCERVMIMNFAEAVSDMRKTLGLTQKQLAETLSVSYATVNRWENSRTEPRPMAIKVITDFCSKNRIEFKWEEANHADE